MKNLSIILISCLLASLFYFAVPAESVTSAIGFIVFSDTHIGDKTVGADGLTNPQRLLNLIAYANTKNKYEQLVNLGDLTQDGGNYTPYLELTANVSMRLWNIKGNHDINATRYAEKVSSLNWMKTRDGILYVGISCVSDTFTEWLNQGLSYNKTTYTFLQTVVTSQEYNSSRYRFLFMHFAPDSTWPLNATHGVSAKFASYLRCFTAIFHGHEGGKESVSFWNNQTLTLKTAHLADGTNATDTFLWIHLYGASSMSIVCHNFVTGYRYTVYSTENLP
jgi:calcineurin-like phosphoesterase family protein